MCCGVVVGMIAVMVWSNGVTCCLFGVEVEVVVIAKVQVLA